MMTTKTTKTPAPAARGCAVVLGDSWSCRDLWNITAQHYHVQHSIAARLEQLDYAVVCIAQQGAGQLEQFAHALRWQRINPQVEPHLVLISWTDWARDRAKPSAPAQFRLEDLTSVTRRAQLAVDTLAQGWPRTHFYHWGGQSPVWASLRLDAQRHTVLYRDFAAHLLGKAPRVDSYATWCAGLTSSREVESALVGLAAWQDPQLTKSLIQQELNHTRACAAHPLFPDGGHAAWSTYDVLFEQLAEHGVR